MSRDLRYEACAARGSQTSENNVCATRGAFPFLRLYHPEENMGIKYLSFWDHMDEFIARAENEFGEYILRGKIANFERDWLDPKHGILSKLVELPWFSDANPRARVYGKQSIDDFVRRMVNCTKLDRRLLDTPAN